MPKMTRAVSKSAGALLLICTVPTASAGWVQDLCEQHRYKMSCIATVCANVPGICPPVQPANFSGGAPWQPGGQGGSDDRYKGVRQSGSGSAEDKSGWNHSERQLYQLMTQTLKGPAYQSTPSDWIQPQLGVPPAFPGLDTPSSVGFELGVTGRPRAFDVPRAVQQSQSK